MLEVLKSVYYNFEDKYYEFLDWASGYVPVYKIIDPIDRIFPSFILFIIIFLLALLLGFFLLLGGGNPLAILLGLLSGPKAKFIVVDKNDTPLGGISVHFSGGGKSEAVTSDKFGELETHAIGKGISVSVSTNKYAEFNDKLDIEAGKEYTIKLKAISQPVTAKSITFDLRDDAGIPLPSGTQVSMSFACSGSSAAPQGFSRIGQRHTISAQSDCGVLNASISSAGFEDTRKQVNVASTVGDVIVNMSRQELFASVIVAVKDAKTKQPVEGASVFLMLGEVTAYQGGITDETGTALFQRVAGGSYTAKAIPEAESGYITGFGAEFSISAQVSPEEAISQEVLLEKADPTKMIYIKFVDNSTSQPLAGVNARLYRQGIFQLPLGSGEDGAVKFTNVDANKYSVVASHPDYVLKVIRDVNVVNAGSSPMVVKLVKAPHPTAGHASVTVLEFSGAKVSGADVSLYSKDYGFALLTDTTGADGNVLFRNLPLGEYYAKAQKNVSGVLMEASSERKNLDANKITDFPIILVIANGKMSVRVKDDSSPSHDVNGAKVTFIDSITGEQLAIKTTNGQGSTGEMAIRVNKRPYVVVGKIGFTSVTSEFFVLTAGATTSVTIVLHPLQQPDPRSPFDVELDGVFNDSGNSPTGTAVQRLLKSKSYWFRFSLIALEDLNNTTFVARAGHENETAASDSNIVLRGFRSFAGDGVYSSCYSLDNNYTPCGTGLGQSGDAKTIIRNFSGGVGLKKDVEYLLFVKAYINDADDGTPIELRFGVKSSEPPPTRYKPSEHELYLWGTNVNSPFCTSGSCGIAIGAKIQDIGKELMPEPVPILQSGLVGLVVGYTYDVNYDITNLSNSRYDNVVMSVSKPPGADPQERIKITGVSNARFSLPASQPSPARGSYQIKGTNTIPSLEIDMNLNLNARGDSLKFFVNSKGTKTMAISFSPSALRANERNNLIIKVKDAQGNAVPGARITMTNRQNPGAPLTIVPDGITAVTGPNGELSALIPSYNSGTAFDVNAAKAGFSNAAAVLTVGSSNTAPDVLSCFMADVGGVEKPVSGSQVEIQLRGASATFTIVNRCLFPVDVNVSRHQSSDITFSKDDSAFLPSIPSFTLPPNASSGIAVKSDKEFGMHPIYFNLKAGQKPYGGIMKARIYDDGVCLFANRATQGAAETGHDYTFDFGKSGELLRFFNRCYTGQVGYGYPTTNLADRAIVNTSEIIGDLPNSYSSYIAELINTGFAENDFFLIITQDYVKGGGG